MSSWTGVPNKVAGDCRTQTFKFSPSLAVLVAGRPKKGVSERPIVHIQTTLRLHPLQPKADTADLGANPLHPHPAVSSVKLWGWTRSTKHLVFVCVRESIILP
ncbi:hypothetical protein CHARACLAT_022714 [Characodon lateralis]|uniref:Uncharacterized protein n=1 Tax=Characodon lateralis TaxID=208331 RepID=A0ABU7DIY4_9TELE|nr:hypothetical protein [Characodon lateralis]